MIISQVSYRTNGPLVEDSLHQNNDALSIFPDPITILTESHSNPRCLATRECKVIIIIIIIIMTLFKEEAQLA